MYGKIVLADGHVVCNGYTEQELEELIDAWRTNAESIGSDIYDLTGDLAIGPKIMEDLLKRVKELEAKIGSQNTETKAETSA